QVEKTLPRILGLFHLLAGTSSGKALLADLIKDIGEYTRWLLAAIDKVKEIDGWIDLYLLLFGTAAKDTEEVHTLHRAPTQYLDAIWDNVISTTARIASVAKEVDGFYADWQGQAGDAKLEKIKEGVTKARSLLSSQTPISANLGGGYSSRDNAYNVKRTLVETA